MCEERSEAERGARWPVYLVGGGPGDPGLITVKGLELLRGCEVLVYDSLVSEALVREVPEGCEKHYVGKRAGEQVMPQAMIGALLVEKALEGKRVVRLKGGDPFIFGRGGEEMEALKAAGICYEVVPAVTAALGCAAYAGIPLTHREHSRAVTFISGHEAEGEGVGVDWAVHARSGATLVLYMAVARLAGIVAALMEGGMRGSMPVSVVEWGTTAAQRVEVTTLAGVVAAVAAAGIGSPAVIIIGEVARYGGSHGWFQPQ